MSMKPSNNQSQQPSSSPQETQAEHPLTLRERVKTFTDLELNQLMSDIEARKEVADELREKGTEEAIEKRMEELKVHDDVRSRWESLRTSIPATSETGKKAEQHFLKEMVDKGGVWAVVGAAAITVLAWLGFKSFKKLRESIKQKGYLRTAIDSAKEHPIFTALIAALGIKVGTDAYRYMLDNREVIEEKVGEYAGETGKNIMEATNDVAEKIGQGADYLKNQSVRGLAKGLAWALGGKYDEATGVVTMPNKLTGGQKSIKPPFVTAWQAGVRSEGGSNMVKKAYSLFLVEDRFDAILRQRAKLDANVREANAGLFVSVQRGKELLAKGVRPGTGTKESLELQRVLEFAIQADPELQKAKPIEVKTATPDEVGERLKHVEHEMKTFYEQEEISGFNRTKSAVNRTAKAAELELQSMASPTARTHLKQDTIAAMQQTIAGYEATVHSRKVRLGQEYAQLLSANEELLGEHARHKLNRTSGSDGRIGQTLDTTVKSAESFGYKVARNPLGKWAVIGISGYSLAPLALQGVAGLQSGKEGEAARTALMYDAGEAVGGFIPGVGEVLDFKAAFTGKDLNGRELDTWQRVTSGAMGTLGAASIAAGFFTGGLTIVGFRAIRGAVAARKAVKVTKLAQAGIETAGVTKKTLKAIEAADVTATTAKALDKAKDSAKTLETMLELTDVQRKARRIQNFIHNGQRTMQVVTYAHLGQQVFSGLSCIYGNADAFINNAFDGAASGVQSVVDFAHERVAPTKK